MKNNVLPLTSDPFINISVLQGVLANHTQTTAISFFSLCPLSSLLSSPPLSLRGARSSRTVSHSHTPARRPRPHTGGCAPGGLGRPPRARRALGAGAGGLDAGWRGGKGGGGECGFLPPQTLGRALGAGSRRWRPRAGCGRQWRRRRQQGLLSLGFTYRS